MAQEAVTYEVEYRYYQYNSGAADNGKYVRRREFINPEDALDLVKRINASIAKTLDESEERELERDLIPWSGYFLGAQAFKVSRAPLPTGS